MLHFPAARGAKLAGLIFLALHTLVALDAVATFAGSAPDQGVPLRISAELGVVAFGSWVWLLAPWVIQAALCLGNLWLAHRSDDPEEHNAILFSNALVGLFLLLGTITTMRQAGSEFFP